MTRADETYPQRLKKLLGGSAPPVLYGSGPQEVLRGPALAIVGSRDASGDALSFARGLAHECARNHVAVISGGARGVDLEAMGAAIEAGGVAVGVTVEPLERLVRRPALRLPLTKGTLTLVTPFHPAARWQASNAMRRNRIVYAMSGAAVVAATAAGSGGTWTGAIENLQHGWVPLYVRAGAGDGGDALARAGAIPLPGPPVRGIDVNHLFHGPHSPGRPIESQETPVGADHNGQFVDIAAAEDRLTQEANTHDQEVVVRAMSSLPATGRGEPEASDVFRAVWPLLRGIAQTPTQRPRSRGGTGSAARAGARLAQPCRPGGSRLGTEAQAQAIRGLTGHRGPVEPCGPDRRALTTRDAGWHFAGGGITRCPAAASRPADRGARYSTSDFQAQRMARVACRAIRTPKRPSAEGMRSAAATTVSSAEAKRRISDSSITSAGQRLDDVHAVSGDLAEDPVLWKRGTVRSCAKRPGWARSIAFHTARRRAARAGRARSPTSARGRARRARSRSARRAAA